MKNLVFIGIGGFAGSVLRYLVSVYFLKAFGNLLPYGTLAVNLLGSLLIGLLAGAFIKTDNQPLQFLLITGFCGGFTTFSTFSLEGLKMLRDSQYLQYSLYISISVIFGILLCLIGFWLSQKVFG
ncbi:MAG: CrcB protein [Marinoscillum sp.]|jgi:CrcB protein